MTKEKKPKRDLEEAKKKVENTVNQEAGKTEVEETKKNGESDAGGDLAAGKKKSTYDEEHTIALEKLEEKLETDYIAGLSKSEAEDRLEKFGPNCLTPPYKTPEWIKFLKTMFTGFAMLLWVAAILCYVAYGIDSANGDPSPDNLYVGIALTIVVIMSGLFTYYQENKSSKIKTIPPNARGIQG